MKNCVQNETSRYALGFDEKSNFDRTTQKLFKEFAAKFEERSFEGMEPRSYFNMILDYNKTIEELDQPFVWSIVDTSKEKKKQKWIACVFGECG